MGGSTQNGHILTKSPLALSPSTTSYSSPFIFVFYPFHRFMLLCIRFAISIHSPPRFFAPSLTHLTYRPYDPLPSLQQRVVSSHNHTRIPCFISFTPPFLFPCSTYTPSTFPTHTITVFTTQSQYLQHNSVLSLHRHTHTTAPLSSLTPSTPTYNSLHQPHSQCG